MANNLNKAFMRAYAKDRQAPASPAAVPQPPQSQPPQSQPQQLKPQPLQSPALQSPALQSPASSRRQSHKQRQWLSQFRISLFNSQPCNSSIKHQWSLRRDRRAAHARESVG